jgi:hypothetical protein
MRANYIVLSALIISLASCSGNDEEQLINTKASLPASFNFNKMDLKVINSSINPGKSTMSTLYGNQPALEMMKSGKAHQGGEVLALVTWKQQEDEHWFGAKIPGALVGIELIKTSTAPNGGRPDLIYQRYAGSELVLNKDTTGKAKSIQYILGQAPSILP